MFSLKKFEVNEDVSFNILVHSEVSIKTNKKSFRMYLVSNIDEKFSEDFLIKGSFLTKLKVGNKYFIKGIINEFDGSKNVFVSEFRENENIIERLREVAGGLAYLIYERFGDDSINILKSDEFERVLEIKHSEIYYDKVFSMHNMLNAFSEVKNKKTDIISQLKKLGLNMRQIFTLLDEYELNVIEEIDKNPYLLLKLNGFGFKTVDKIASFRGIPKTSKLRIDEGIKYSLNEYFKQTGDTYIDAAILIDRLFKLLDLPKKDITQKIKEKIKLGDLVLKVKGEFKRIYPNYLYKAEFDILQKITYMKKHRRETNKELIYKILNDYINNNNYKLEEKQYQAIKLCLESENGLNYIDGPAGSGKTFITKIINDVFMEYRKQNGSYAVSIIITPTGKASKVAAGASKMPAKTIHKALGITQYNTESTGRIHLFQDLIFVDESTMIDVELAKLLFSNFNLNKKVIFLGDNRQLPSIGPGDFFRNIKNEIDGISLDKVKRQGDNSIITEVANLVNDGKFPSVKETKNDTDEVNFYYDPDETKLLSVIIEKYKERLNFFSDVQILSNTKGGITGTNSINAYINKKINKNKDSDILLFEAETYIDSKLKTEKIFLKENDKVMNIINDYEKKNFVLLDGEISEDYNKKGVINGEVGFVLKIEDGKIYVKMIDDENKVVIYTKNEALDYLELSYAMTIHKSQGSGFDSVILTLSKKGTGMMSKNILYTGVTRSKKILDIVSDKKLIEKAVSKSTLRLRQTGLR